MEKIFETLKVQMSVPTTSSPNNSPTKPFNLHQSKADGGHHVRKSQNNATNNATSTAKKHVVKADRNKNNTSPPNFQKRENSSPIDILFQTAAQNYNNSATNSNSNQKSRRSSTGGNNHWRGSPPNRGRENCTPPNVVSSPNNYAGPKFIESPSPRSLPLPPLHWLQASRQVTGLQTQTSPSLKVN